MSGRAFKILIFLLIFGWKFSSGVFPKSLQILAESKTIVDGLWSNHFLVKFIEKDITPKDWVTFLMNYFRRQFNMFKDPMHGKKPAELVGEMLGKASILEHIRVYRKDDFIEIFKERVVNSKLLLLAKLENGKNLDKNQKNSLGVTSLMSCVTDLEQTVREGILKLVLADMLSSPTYSSNIVTFDFPAETMKILIEFIIAEYEEVRMTYGLNFGLQEQQIKDTIKTLQGIGSQAIFSGMKEILPLIKEPQHLFKKVMVSFLTSYDLIKMPWVVEKMKFVMELFQYLEHGWVEADEFFSIMYSIVDEVHEWDPEKSAPYLEVIRHYIQNTGEANGVWKNPVHQKDFHNLFLSKMKLTEPEPRFMMQALQKKLAIIDSEIPAKELDIGLLQRLSLEQSQNLISYLDSLLVRRGLREGLKEFLRPYLRAEVASLAQNFGFYARVYPILISFMEWWTFDSRPVNEQFDLYLNHLARSAQPVWFLDYLYVLKIVNAILSEPGEPFYFSIPLVPDYTYHYRMYTMIGRFGGFTCLLEEFHMRVIRPRKMKKPLFIEIVADFTQRRFHSVDFSARNPVNQRVIHQEEMAVVDPFPEFTIEYPQSSIPTIVGPRRAG